ncbi:hypothetical protein BH10BAC5_BH10BAC5_16120 [soil metagenome]
MKILRYILLFVIFLPSCRDNPLDPIERYTGNWRIVFSSENNIKGYSIITISQNGTFCSKFIAVYPSAEFFVEGTVNNSGILTGNLSKTCGSQLRDTLAGFLYDVGGITSGEGIWSDSVHILTTNCTWMARRQ